MVLRFLIGLGLFTALTHPALAADGRLLQIFVSKDSQTLQVYDGTEVIATSRVSTGKPGHGTPSGIFSVIEKQKYHESNLYSAAPMPWMQRLTWSGIALHESNSVPRHPASHGCVRLPAAFAKELYKITETGVPVIISDSIAAPQPVEHASLFRPYAAPSPTLLSDAGLRPGIGSSNGTKPVQIAMNDVGALGNFHEARPSQPTDPVRILITRRTDRETIADIQRMLNKLGFSAGQPDGMLGAKTVEAIKFFKSLRPAEFRKDKALASERLLQALYTSAGMGTPPNAAILVRQNFRPLFEEPITIAEPERPLGTHFLTLRSLDAESGKAEWLGTSLANKLTPKARQRLGIRSESDTADLTQVLDRIEVPDALRQRIGMLLVTGSTMTISDTGLGPETGPGTDFITVTRG